MTARAQTVTILFTDLVGSTELLQRTGDEHAQRIFNAHHRLLSDAVVAHRGHEVKWLGDGLMAAFTSVQDAVECAVAMQRAFQRPMAGERLEMRAGINVGEVYVEDGDYFGTPVVVARRLCDRAEQGQVFASELVVRLLEASAAGVESRALGRLELKGIAQPVAAVEILYGRDPLALLRLLPFVGRQSEYATLLSKLAGARNGRGSIVLLAGEPGVGKTRLAEEFCEHASGARVIRGNCYEGDVAAPFGPWIEALRALVAHMGDDELRSALGPHAPEVAAILPEIRQRLPDTGDPPRLEPESERARLFDGIASFLRNAASATPLVILLDDLHWSDRPSLALLEQVARAITDRRIVILGTYRDVEVDQRHVLTPTLAAVRRMEHHERLSVQGFSTDAIYELMTVIEPSPSAERTRRALAGVLREAADGNPFFIREVLNSLVETGKLVQQDGVWTGGEVSLAALEIPEGVKEITGRRLARLSDACTAMLRQMSVMTTGFSWDELQAVCDEQEETLLGALDEALASQLLAERARNEYAFTHALIRAALYDELSTPRRILLHRRTAEALEELYADDLDAHLGELAAHYVASLGGAAEKAVEYSTRAGDKARDLLAWEEAAAHYQRALDAMSLLKTRQPIEQCRVLLALAKCNRVALRDAESLDALRTLIALAREAPSPEYLALGAIAFEEAAERLEGDHAAERLALLDEGLRVLGEGDSALKAEAMCLWVRASAAAANVRRGMTGAGFLAWAGEPDAEILSRAHEAVAMAERVGDDVVTARAVRVLHDYGWTPDNDQERLALIDRGLAAADRAGSLFLEGELRNARAMDLMALGDIEEFQQNAQRYGDVVERLRARGGYVLPMRVGIEIVQGKLDDAEQHLDEYASSMEADVSLVFTSIGQRYGLRHMQGQLTEVEGMWRAFVTRLPGLPLFPAVLAWIEACTDRPEEAARTIDDLVRDEFGGIPRDFAWKATMCLIADTCGEIEARQHAPAIYSQLVPYAGTATAVTQILALGSTARVLGRMAGLMERWDDAQDHFEQALSFNQRLGFDAWTAWTKLNYGDMLLRRGNGESVDRARAMLGEAAGFARQTGMGKVLADAERLLG